MNIIEQNDGLRIRLDSELETERLGRALAACAAPGTVIGLVGPLGAGKTRLVRSVAEALGADADEIASPTFVLLHEYHTTPPLYHFDAYRLRHPDEFEASGASEYFRAQGVCLVEWADRVIAYLPDDAWWVRLDHEPANPHGRRARFEAPRDVRNTLERLLKSGRADAPG